MSAVKLSRKTISLTPLTRDGREINKPAHRNGHRETAHTHSYQPFGKTQNSELVQRNMAVSRSLSLYSQYNNIGEEERLPVGAVVAVLVPKEASKQFHGRK
jgi:hypothetical protein